MKKMRAKVSIEESECQNTIDSSLSGCLSDLDDLKSSDSDRQAQIRSGFHQWDRHMSERRDLSETYYQHKKRSHS